MKIKEILLYLPKYMLAGVAKSYRTELDDNVKNKILEEGMYHFVPDEEIAQKICDSEYLKPATGSMKYIDSYGTPVACLFCGVPELENYSKNITGTNLENNPYINPCKVSTAVKILPENKEQLKNYKIRNLSDSAILYEGYCVLPHERIQIQKMVPDLARDESGNPIKDNKGEYQVKFREARKEELIEGSDLYLAQKDYLDYMKQKAIELGYSKDNNGIIHKLNNNINSITDQNRMDVDIAKDSFRENANNNFKNIFIKLKNILNRIKTPKLENSTENVIQDFKFGLKNPYQDEKFGLFVSEIQSKQGLKQLSLETVLKDFNQSKEGEYFSNKYKEVESNMKGSNLHGKSHANRVLINSMIIARKGRYIRK